MDALFWIRFVCSTVKFVRLIDWFRALFNVTFLFHLVVMSTAGRASSTTWPFRTQSGASVPFATSLCTDRSWRGADVIFILLVGDFISVNVSLTMVVWSALLYCSVVTQMNENITVGQEITMRLMVCERASVWPFPVTEWHERKGIFYNIGGSYFFLRFSEGGFSILLWSQKWIELMIERSILCGLIVWLSIWRLCDSLIDGSDYVPF